MSWLDGTVDIDARPGGGCRVTVTLPLEPAQQPPEHPPVDQETPAGVKSVACTPYQIRGRGPIRVLIADDHALLREGLVRILLQDPHFSVVGEAESGEAAVAQADRLKPDVVLMDVMMPGMGGAEATRRIKQAHPGTEVVALSMYREDERGEEMQGAGASAYITKAQAASTVCNTIINSCRKPGRSGA